MMGNTGEQLYSYKPSLIGAPWQFALERDGMRWTKGTRSGVVAYRDIRRMRLSFRPVTMMFDRHRLEIWSEKTPRIEIVSASMKSMIEQEKQGAAFTRFITELHCRVAQAGGRPRLETGIHVVLYFAGAAIFAAMGLAMIGLILRALQTQSWAAAAFIVAFVGFFIWQALTFFRANKPGTYTLDRLPQHALPRPG